MFSPSMQSDPAVLERAYDHCQQVAKEHAKNFYYAFRTLPAPKRRAIYAAYAICRLWDDIADDDAPLSEKYRMFAETRRTLASILSRSVDDAPESNCWKGLPPEFIALADATNAFGIPLEYYDQILEGVESDLVKDRFANFDELRDYCYKVASVVGLICIEVFGYDDPRAEDYAVDMGIALQLTNILRDLDEDAGRDRIYLPQDELARFGCTEDDLRAGQVNDAFRELMRFQAQRARAHFQSGFQLLPYLNPRSRACVTVLGRIYSRLLDRIEAADYDVFSQRVSLSTTEKLGVMAQSWATSMWPRGTPEPPRQP